LIGHVFGSIITTMTHDLTTTKMTKAALQAARLIAAKTGELQYVVVERVLLAEAKRLDHTKPAMPKREEAFQTGLRHLLTFLETHHIDELTRDYVAPDGYRLGSWCQYQRHNRHLLSAERTKALEAVPDWIWRKKGRAPAIDWWTAEETPAPLQRDVLKTKRHEERSRETFGYWLAVLQQYVEREGHADVPTRHKEGADQLPLGRWVSMQRMARDTLPEDQAKALEILPGWAWRKRVSTRGWQTVEDAA
jgi:hypothetical protein